MEPAGALRLVVALLAIRLIGLIRRRRAGSVPPRQVSRPADAAGADIFADLRQRYARGEVSPEEYPDELVRVHWAIGLYNPFHRNQPETRGA